MKIWAIAWKDMRIRMRDRKGIIMLILMPLILTLILGSALSGVFNEEANSLPEMKIAVTNGDSGDIGKQFVEQVLQGEGLQDRITLVTFDGMQAVSDEVANGRADAGVVIPAGFSGAIRQGQATAIRVFEDPGKALKAQIVRSMAAAFTERISVVSAASKTVITDLAKSMAVPVNGTPGATADPQAEISKMAAQVVAEVQGTATAPQVGVKQEPVGEKAVSAQQYYAVAMAVMFLLFNGSIGAKSILEERANETLSRMIATPTSRAEILLGKFVGTTLFTMLQFIVLLAATRFTFGIDWGSDTVQILVLGAMYTIAVSGLAMVVASVLKSAQSADVVTAVGVQILSVLGGSMLPLSAFPDALHKVAMFTPNAWALSSFIDIISGTTWTALLQPLGVLFAIGTVSLALGTWRLSAR
ncbi:MAG: ABC transporter permease [Tumebacillaceae bacterium]